MTAKATQILDRIHELTGDDPTCTLVFGIRADLPGFAVGDAFPNSCQWWQDWQEWWGDEDDVDAQEQHPYNEEFYCYYDGELDGTCTLGVSDFPDAQEIQRLLDDIDIYQEGGRGAYLVVGDSAQAGNDIGESIIHGARCAMVIE